MHLHILGICGTFMAGIAALAREAGHRVTGSDANAWPPMSTQLEAQGIELMSGYAPEHLQPAPDVVVVLVTIAFTQFVLQFKRFTSRAQQTVNSLLCTDIVFKLLLLPVLFWIGPDVLRQFSENPQMLEQGQVPGAPMMVLFALSLWNLAVSAHIYRCALEIGIFMGVGITCLLYTSPSPRD